MPSSVSVSSVTLAFLLTTATIIAQDKPSPLQNGPPKPISSTAHAPKPAERSRATIGVALEGGGALGLAHIGVLKWFEEHHIPVDYVAGTSMGGLVGGLYSTGKSANDLENLVNRTDWPFLLRGGTPYRDLAFRRKEDAREVPNNLQIGLRNGPTLPPGLNTGQLISLLIDHETLPYSTINSFNELPIPFRCVATELVSGRAFVFNDGRLSRAMRATMSIPGVFDPVREGNKVFVDGGLVDNLPSDVVRKMGADVVIAVHLQISSTTAEDLQSAFSILGRSVRISIAETELRGMENADLVVVADVQDYSTMDYDRSESLIQRGYDAAQQKARILKPYALDDAEWTEYIQQKKSRLRTYIGVPQFVRVEGVGLEAQRDIEGYLRPLIGVPINTEEVDSHLNRLTGLGRYSSATYSMVHEEGRDGLLVVVSEKSYAPPVLLPSFIVDGSAPKDVTFTFGARIVATDVLGEHSELRTDIQFGETYGLQTELYRPFTRLSKWFIQPFAGGQETTFNIYAKSDPRAVYQLGQVLGGVDFGYTFNRFNQISAGYGVGYKTATLRLGQPEFSSYSGRTGALRFRYVRDHTNEPVIPTAGYLLESQFYYYDTSPGATEAFPSLDLYASYFRPVWEKGSMFFVARGGSTFGREGTGTPQFFLGGPGRLSAYGLNELFGNQYFLGRTGYLRSIFSLPPFVGGRVYFYGAAEVGKMYNDTNAPRLSGDGVVGVLADTHFGPILIGGSVGDTGHEKWFFQLGRVF